MRDRVFNIRLSPYVMVITIQSDTIRGVMINKDIVSYIRAQQKLGISQQVIIDNLKQAGWSGEVISDSYNDVIANNTIPQPEKVEVKQVEVESVNSPYSSILSAVLVISLFILTNGIFSDIKNMVATENKILLLQGLFVIPFLLAAFLLHSSFREQKKRFEILSYPYFIISAWILLRLLWKVGQNIWEANNALGVYIVLGMVIAVLTGVIIFVQRYIKK